MTIYPTPGNPNVYATSGDQWLVGDPNYNYVGYPGASNTVTYQLATGPVIASLATPSSNTGDAAGDTYSDIQNLTGSPYGSILQGDNSGQTEQLWALGGTNTLYGGSGYTTFISGPGADAMYAGAGGGLADYEVATAGVVVSLSNPSMNAGYGAGDTYSNVHNIAGSGYDDALYADNYGDNLLGNGGDNLLVGGNGSNTLNGGPGANVFVGGEGVNWFVFGGVAEGPGDVPMDPLSIIYNAEAGIYSVITDFDQGYGTYSVGESDRIDIAPLVSLLNDGANSVGSLVQVVEDTSGSFAWLEFNGPAGWVTLARMDGLQAGETVGVILNESDSTGYAVTVQATPLTNTTTTDEWVLADGQWSASVSAGSYPGADEKVVGIGDFTGNGTDDVLWYNVNTGDVSEWQLSNGTWAASVDFGGHPGVGGTDPGPGWQVEGVGDFTGNGIDDILWYNAGDNQIDIWELSSNGQWAASVNPGTHPNVGEEVAGIGDFYNNGTDDILWYNVQTGDVDEWQISNGQWAASVDLGSHGSGWQVAGIGNFFGPNTASDVLWYNPSTGQTDIWELANGQWQASVSPGTHPTGYEVAAVGNFSGNGTSDILFYNPTTGDTDEWVIANGKWAGSIDLGTHAGQVAGAGDFTHSGTSDVLWTQYALK